MAHPNPGSAVSMWQANVLDVNPRAVPAFVLGQLLSCSPASAGGDPVHCRGLVSLQGACGVVPRRLGMALGGVAVGRGSAASCCCREVAVGPGPGGLADVSPYRCGVCPPWGPQGLDSLTVASCTEHSRSCASLGKKTFHNGKVLGKVCSILCPSGYFRLGQVLQTPWQELGTGFITGGGTGLFLQSHAGCLLISHGSCLDTGSP